MLLASARTNASSKLYIDDLFSVYLRTGTGADVTTTTGIDMTKGYMLWSKGRSGATDHAVYDSERGATYDLVTNSTAAQTTQTTGLKSVSSTGHTIGSLAKMNTSSATYVDFVFRKAPKFFDVQTKSHTNGTASTVDLSALGTVGMVTVKATSTTSNWYTWHRSLTAGNNLKLNLTDAQSTTNAYLSVSGTTLTIASTAPTATYVVYAFAHDTATDGMIQSGSFTTDGSGNATVNLGWEPQYVLLKCSSLANQPWVIIDSIRGWTDGTATDGILYANTADAEFQQDRGYPTATGFRPFGAAGQTYIYLAIRRPNKPPTSGTEVYNAIARTGTGVAATVTGVGFAPDLVVPRQRDNADAASASAFYDRLRGRFIRLITTELGPDNSVSQSVLSFDMDGVSYGTDSNLASNSTNFIDYFLRRAYGFHDQICYTGTGANKTEAHNLGKQPELWLAKRRNTAGSWVWGSTLLNANEKIVMPSVNGRVADSTAWNSTYPTATNISLGTLADVNASGGTYTLYMWATLAGISKVGTYTGNGSSQTIDCGFTTGARFIMIIRMTASTAQDIYLWDSARGIVAGNDPHLSLNTTAAEVTTDDSVDPDAIGFIVNQVAATNINVSGASYIFLSIS